MQCVCVRAHLHVSCIRVCICSGLGLGEQYCTQMDSATKSLRQAEGTVSVCNIRLSSVSVSERTGCRLWQSLGSQLITAPDAVHSILNYRHGKSNMRAEKRDSHDIIVRR